jgi:hypothetical protein
MLWGALGVGALIAAFGGLAARYAAQSSRLEQSWLHQVEPRLTSIGEVDELSILPVVERLVPSEPLVGEPGVSYHLRAGQTTFLFDSGLNRRGQASSALAQNASTLKVNLQRWTASLSPISTPTTSVACEAYAAGRLPSQQNHWNQRDCLHMSRRQ